MGVRAVAEGGWCVVGCGWRAWVLAGWTGSSLSLYCLEFATHEKRSASQMSFFIIYLLPHFCLKLEKEQQLAAFFVNQSFYSQTALRRVFPG